MDIPEQSVIVRQAWICFKEISNPKKLHINVTTCFSSEKKFEDTLQDQTDSGPNDISLIENTGLHSHRKNHLSPSEIAKVKPFSPTLR